MYVSPDAVLVLTGSISNSISAMLELTVLYEYPLVFLKSGGGRASASAILGEEELWCCLTSGSIWVTCWKAFRKEFGRRTLEKKHTSDEPTNTASYVQAAY